MDSLRHQLFSTILIPLDCTHRPYNQQEEKTCKQSDYEYCGCTPDKIHYTTHPAPLTAHTHIMQEQVRRSDHPNIEYN
jgi:hypothetical protein